MTNERLPKRKERAAAGRPGVTAPWPPLERLFWFLASLNGVSRAGVGFAGLAPCLPHCSKFDIVPGLAVCSSPGNSASQIFL